MSGGSKNGSINTVFHLHIILYRHIKFMTYIKYNFYEVSNCACVQVSDCLAATFELNVLYLFLKHCLQKFLIEKH